MHEVTFYVKFVTGASHKDKTEALDACRDMLLDCLRKGTTIESSPNKADGLFEYQILGEHSEEL